MNISFQLKDLLARTIQEWVSLFEEENKEYLPLFKMELTFDDEKMQFYPPSEDLEETLLYVVEKICSTLQKIPTIESWLSYRNVSSFTDAAVAEHIVQNAVKTLKEAVKKHFMDPLQHLQFFGWLLLFLF